MKKLVMKLKTHEKEILYVTVYGLVGALAVVTVQASFRKEMFHQVEMAVDELGLTKQLVDHMKAHGPY